MDAERARLGAVGEGEFGVHVAASRGCQEKLLNGVAAFRRCFDRSPVAYLRQVHDLLGVEALSEARRDIGSLSPQITSVGLARTRLRKALSHGWKLAGSVAR